MTAPQFSFSENAAPRPSLSLDAGTQREPLVALVGNPNVGKTTLFNRLTGQNARVGNYPGITVERRSGKLELSEPETGEVFSVELVDVPGTYSLSARSAEEQVTLSAILGFAGNPRPDLVVAVVDAGQLVRNLYFVLELGEFKVPLLIVLNMIDEVERNRPDVEAISIVLGVPCVATDARHGRGISELEAAIALALHNPARSRAEVKYPPELRRDIDRIADALPQAWRTSVERDRAFATWALLSIEPDDELTGVPPPLRERCREVRAAAAGRDFDLEIIGTRYEFLDRCAPELFRRVERHPPKRAYSERIDRVLLHPLFGFVIFLSVMVFLFQALFSWADPLIGLVEKAFAAIGSLAIALLPEGILRDLLVEGVIGGVGNVVVFLPQILLLFLFIGVLEDSGYMARVAYLMDRVMRSLGLHGRAFVPMLSGFACAVPAILATRTMERRRDRLLTMMVIPLMTCSARLPVYTLIVAALFPPMELFGWLPLQGLLMIGMYVFSVLITLIAAAVLGRTAIKGRRIPLILELPPYRAPDARSILRTMWERSWVFLREAGTVILFCTIALWALLSFPRDRADHVAGRGAERETASELGPAPERASRIENSYGGQLGKAIEPAIAPLGFDWKIGVGLIGAFAAREVFVSTMGLLYGMDELDDEARPLREKMRAERRANGTTAYTPLVGLSLMVFFALACQCMSTLAVVRRETRSWRWPAFMLAYMTALAYLASLLVYQGGRLLGL